MGAILTAIGRIIASFSIGWLASDVKDAVSKPTSVLDSLVNWKTGVLVLIGFFGYLLIKQK